MNTKHTQFMGFNKKYNPTLEIGCELHIYQAMLKWDNHCHLTQTQLHHEVNGWQIIRLYLQELMITNSTELWEQLYIFHQNMLAESCVDDSDHVDEQTKNLLSVFPIRTKDPQARILTQIKKNRLQQLLTCPICLTLFRDPVSIKECSHRFCKDCIEKYIRYQQNKSCPICRKRIGSKRQLRIDEALQNFMKSIFGSLELTYQQEEKKFQQDLQNTVKFQPSKKQIKEQNNNTVINKNYLINIQLIAQNQLISQVPLSNLRIPASITMGYISELLSDYLCQTLEIVPYLDFYIGNQKLDNESTLIFLNDKFWQIYTDQTAYDPNEIKWTSYTNNIPQRIIHYNIDRLLQSIQ